MQFIDKLQDKTITLAQVFSELSCGYDHVVNQKSDPNNQFQHIGAEHEVVSGLLYHAPDAIFIESLEGFVLDVNKKACQLHGMSREELIGKHVSDLVPADQREIVLAEFPQFADGQMQLYEGYSLHKNGQSIPVELIASKIQYHGTPALQVHVRDLSTRKALHANDNLNDALMQSLPGGMLRLDINRRIVSANDQARDFLCLTQDSESLFYNLPEDCQLYLEDGNVGDLSKHWPGYLCMEQMKRQKEITLGFKCLNCCNDQIRWGVFTAVPLLDPKTRLCQGAVVSFVDTTTLRSTILALRESEYRFHMAFDHAPMGMVLSKLDGKFSQINQRFCNMLGYTWSELIKLSYPEICPPEDQKRCEAFLQTVLGNKATLHHTQKRYLHKKGHIVSCQATVTVIYDEQGKPQYCLSQIEDLTPQIKAKAQRHALEERLRQAQKLQAVGTLASGVAHDFNNLLLAIESYLDMAQTQFDRGENPTQSLQNIRQVIRQSAGMTRSLLTFAKHTNGNRQLIDMAQLIEQSLQTLKPLIPTSIQIQVDNQIKSPLVLEVDVSQIQQLLMNLVVNARDVMPKGGTLTFRLESERCESRHPQLILWVCDTGVGMEKEIIDRIFDPFFTTKARSQGTGLGLAVVHGIITDHKATIEVFSVPNEGTQFKITFPATHVPENQPPEAPPILQPQRRIILVQNDPMLEQILRAMLSKHQILIQGATNAKELLSFLQQNPQIKYDLMLCNDQSPSQPCKPIIDDLKRRNAYFQWVVMTTQNTPPTDQAYASKALILTHPMPVRKLAQRLLDILNDMPEPDQTKTLKL